MAAPTGREARIAGDTFYGYGEYAQAAELYRAALQKGGEDANLLNIRLGASLAGARQTRGGAGRLPRRDRAAPAACRLLADVAGAAGTAAAPATPASGAGDVRPGNSRPVLRRSPGRRFRGARRKVTRGVGPRLCARLRERECASTT